jgi:hypothetical protein
MVDKKKKADIEIKVFAGNPKLQEAYEELQEEVDRIVKKFELSYFELFGVLKCLDCDIMKLNITEDEDGD